MKQVTKDNRKIQSVARALDILEVLSNAPGELALNEIAVMTGLNVSTCHHIVQTLLDRGCESGTEGAGYTLGSRVLELPQCTAVYSRRRRHARTQLQIKSPERMFTYGYAGQ